MPCMEMFEQEKYKSYKSEACADADRIRSIEE